MPCCGRNGGSELSRNQRWRQVWEAKAPSTKSLTLKDLIAIDGFDTGHGDITPSAWLDFASETMRALRLKPGDTVFEVGCGAGAFLHSFYQAGLGVSGVDYASPLVTIAKRAMPGGDFRVQEADAFDPRPSADAVMAFSVFIYFDGLEYAGRVIERMCQKADRAVAILDLLDASHAASALTDRQRGAGGEEAYARRYAGLEHQAYEPEWVLDQLSRCGMKDAYVEQQRISGYGNGSFRFNAYAFR